MSEFEIVSNSLLGIIFETLLKIEFYVSMRIGGVDNSSRMSISCMPETGCNREPLLEDMSSGDILSIVYFISIMIFSYYCLNWITPKLWAAGGQNDSIHGYEDDPHCSYDFIDRLEE